ncbi:PRD domain-containing protein [Photorhabdus laumondii subsp. laumondii]|uniref:Cryptic beta-glucoside bgl operon antiterminator n=2 Tax=Photorhabdus laumondii subsp. laumondii TaxID=141679 RepID=Q7N8X9_PHOLL|nr:PRD domain-containing protein [Photorhabdus laumondii]AWK44429.1 antiterminator Bgl [Photorhabdus laumondii subsp. laumondii]NHB60175.1 PRD domain-containing protein [Photorhabdus sp. RW14-46]RAW73455.1 antiterminator Bgl [Photorhabdus sp. S7-51]RAW75044.1 antiterminator Bgl [Photorhabdus sp. S14-60]RAW79376.1 antiterminator Bgl [Photorhabdus sp. S15-56]RAW84084.1 antiterminator Bgl [Photorhabdus sp. S12-55]RAW84159.1 antiterminator Bgl [Photorhabdus sp. S5P8-50]
MLTIVKLINNNVVLAIDENNNEVILMDKGIGFNRKKGDRLNVQDVAKVFTVEKNDRINQIIATIPVSVIELTEKIIALGKDLLGKSLNDSLLITLSEHLNFAFERVSKGYQIGNVLQWEIPHLYPLEYEVGKQALIYINGQIEKPLPPIEASLIALHFVNAQYEGQTMGDTLKLTNLINKTVKLIHYYFHVNLDTTSVNYSRFITHLRYFLIRQNKNEHSSAIEMDFSLQELIEEKYFKSYNCAVKLIKYLREKYQWKVPDDELIYLVIHIERVVNDSYKSREL